MTENDGCHPADVEVSPVDRLLEEGQLLVVSNREPYTHEYDDEGGIEVSRPAGGLTAALDPVLRELGGTWVAWGSGDADAAVVDDHDRVAVPPDHPAYDLRRVWLDEDAIEGYYYGYSNQVLWPLCHGLPGKVNYDDTFWERYRQVNERFADAVRREVARDDGDTSIVWFQDYHLGLAPRMVRRRIDAERTPLLAHFWHIPWPPWDVFRRCPRGRELLTALLTNDLLGFHTRLDRRQFVRCAERVLDATYDPGTGALLHDGGRTVLRAAPVQFDADAVVRRARSDAADAYWRSLAAEYGLDDGGVQVALGVDRLDYTKGIEERLDALERLWEESPEWRGALTYVQKASESRTEIDEYRALGRRVRTRIDEINRRFGTDDWQPVVYRNELVSPAELAGLYRHADVALVTPLRDGLNLVAKEYVAAQAAADDAGVLVLSDAAGIVEELGDSALVATPLETDRFAETVRRAVEMSGTDRRRRMRALAETVRGTDGTEWVRNLFHPLADAPEGRHGNQEPYAFVE